MARTLNEILRKRRSDRNSSSSPGSRMKLSELRKRKSELQRWMEPLYNKKRKSVVIVDSSDDEAASRQTTNNPLGSSKATAIEIDEQELKVNFPEETSSSSVKLETPKKNFSHLPVTQCHAITNKNILCKIEARKGSKYCRRHKGYYRSNPSPPVKETPVKSEAQVVSRPSMKSSMINCIAMTQRKHPCKSLALYPTPYCSKHNKMVEKYGHCRDIEKIAPAKGGSDEFDFDQSVSKGSGQKVESHKTEASEKDTVYLHRARKGKERCIAITTQGKLCSYHAVNSTVYCHLHGQNKFDELSPKSKSSICELERCSSASIAGKDAGNDDDSSSGSDSGDSDSEDDNVLRPFKHKEFLRMWSDCEEYCGEATDEIENTRRVRGANQKMCPEDTDGQLKAQYGRLLPRAMKRLMGEIMGLKREDVFLDIGHGIGNTCIQAAFTTGCEARGIEVVYGRNSVAEVFRDNLEAQNKDSPRPRIVGKVGLRHGRLEDDQHQEFLTRGVTRAYVNNFNGVFAERSSKSNQKWFLDDYVAALYALMAPGALMVTLHPLNLGPTKSEANKMRKKQGLKESENASFYEVEKVLLGKACDTVKWNQHSGNQKNIYVYKYTRMLQPDGDSAVFLCCNPSCQLAKDEVPISATRKNEEDRRVMNHCECKVTTKNLRRQRRKVYTDH